MASKDFELIADQLRVGYRAEELGFETTADLPSLTGTVGQDRAMAAIDFGLHMTDSGYNIFAAGPTGTGRNFAVSSKARETASSRPAADDWCYVNNFDDPRRPLALRLSAGCAPEFSQDVDELIASAKQEVPRVFESESYEQRKEQAVGDVQSERNRLLRQLDEEARAEGLMIQATPMGIITLPLQEGRPMSREQFEQLLEDERKNLEEKMEKMRERIGDTLSQARQLEKEARRRLEELDREVAMFAIGHRFEEIKAKYQDNPGVVAYLERMSADIIDNLDEFRSGEAPERDGLQAQPPMAGLRYRANVLVTNKPDEGAPVVEENSPTYYNLVGRLEYRPLAGGAVTDFTLIKPGAIHRANGGFLILQVLDVLRSPFAWEALKRTLRSREATIENIGEQFTPIPAAGLRPEPIPLNVKVILVGSPLLFFLLYHYDEEFARLFKVKADFDSDMSSGPEACRSYTAFIATHCRANNLRHLRNDAVARVIEYGARLASDQEKLSTRFMAVADLLAEADFWASREGAEIVTTAHIEQALEQKEYRSRRLEDRTFEFIARGFLRVDVDGGAVGQINGLAVLEIGDYFFGRPSRITSRVMPGRAGVVNIEREARLSGDIHHKAVMILSGYLSGTYATEAPLSLSATLCFEQSYDLVEGDSASCAELYTILSGLSGVPINQGIAVTGSVDQFGVVQAIGGVNQKIEGFFTVCKLKGISGQQGVMIPRQNVKNLMLKPEVTQAVKEGKFHIWAVSTVDEGIEILTGIPAGPIDNPDSIHGRVAARLREFSEVLTGKEERTTRIIETAPPATPIPGPPAPPPPPEPPMK